MTSWILLLVAGVLEVVWAVAMKLSAGFTRPGPTVAFVVALAISMVLLSVATRSIPIGTAYAVWVGIGAAGAALLGIVLLGEPPTLGRLFFLGLLIVAIVGLKLTSP